MNPSRCHIFAALALVLAFSPVTPSVKAQGMNPVNMANRLDRLVTLTSSQRAQAVKIFAAENQALQAFTSIEDRMIKGAPVRQAAMAQIRALLTPAQQEIYDSAPQTEGGGLTRPSPADLTARLNNLVALTDLQKAQAMQVFAAQNKALQPLNSLPIQDRAKKGGDINQAARIQIRAILTPEQQQIYDSSPQTQGGGSTVPQAATRASRMDDVVAFTDTQIPQVALIYQKETEALQQIPPDDRPIQGKPIRQAAQAQIRALLTPEQQQKFDANPNGIEDLEERTYVANFVLSSPGIAARLGKISKISRSDAMVIMSEGDVSIDGKVVATYIDPSMSGSYTYKVTGAQASEVLRVDWTRVLPTSEIKIVKIEGHDGSIIQP